MKLFLRHPIVIFLVGGACIFALDQKLRWSTETPVTLSAAEIDGLRKDLQQRGETGAEAFEAAHQAALDEAILVHEAQRLGLVDDDPIVRRRLAQVMRFFLLEQQPVAEPTKAQLETHLRGHKARYQQPRRVSFEHHFFAGKGATQRSVDALPVAQSGGTVNSDAFPHGQRLEHQSEARLQQRFGGTFAATLMGQQVGPHWHRVDSSFGSHLVRITAYQKAGAPELKAVAKQVRQDWLRTQREKALKAAMKTLRRQHRPSP